MSRKPFIAFLLYALTGSILLAASVLAAVDEFGGAGTGGQAPQPVSTVASVALSAPEFGGTAPHVGGADDLTSGENAIYTVAFRDEKGRLLKPHPPAELSVRVDNAAALYVTHEADKLFVTGVLPGPAVCSITVRVDGRVFVLKRQFSVAEPALRELLPRKR